MFKVVWACSHESAIGEAAIYVLRFVEMLSGYASAASLDYASAASLDYTALQLTTTLLRLLDKLDLKINVLES